MNLNDYCTLLIIAKMFLNAITKVSNVIPFIIGRHYLLEIVQLLKNAQKYVFVVTM